jgi:hypothetical protein
MNSKNVNLLIYFFSLFWLIPEGFHIYRKPNYGIINLTPAGVKHFGNRLYFYKYITALPFLLNPENKI